MSFFGNTWIKNDSLDYLLNLESFTYEEYISEISLESIKDKAIILFYNLIQKIKEICANIKQFIDKKLNTIKMKSYKGFKVKGYYKVLEKYNTNMLVDLEKFKEAAKANNIADKATVAHTFIYFKNTIPSIFNSCDSFKEVEEKFDDIIKDTTEQEFEINYSPMTIKKIFDTIQNTYNNTTKYLEKVKRQAKLNFDENSDIYKNSIAYLCEMVQYNFNILSKLTKLTTAATNQLIINNDNDKVSE